MSKNQAAFPSPGVIFTEPNTKQQRQQGAYEGMSLRDYFAAKALQGFSANPDFTSNTPNEIAKMAYDGANAMLAAREMSK